MGKRSNGFERQPRVISLKGRKPPVLGAHEIYIGRAVFRGGWHLAGSPWANPYSIGRDGSRAEILSRYEELIRDNPALMARLPELTGKTLACWCYPERCHGDVLVKLCREM